LARLCEMVSSWVCWASMPVFEIHRERIMAGAFRSIPPMVPCEMRPSKVE
jgi:hypothetical protein